MATWKDFIEKKSQQNVAQWQNNNISVNSPPETITYSRSNGNGYEQDASGTEYLTFSNPYRNVANGISGLAQKGQQHLAGHIIGNSYLQGNLIREFAKGVLEGPVQAPAIVPGVMSGIASSIRGEGFRKGWENGTGDWDKYVSGPWRKFIKTLGMPLIEGYDAKQREYIDKYRGIYGNESAKHLQDAASALGIPANFAGAFAGVGGWGSAPLKGVNLLLNSGKVARYANAAAKGAKAFGRMSKAVKRGGRLGYLGAGQIPAYYGGRDILDSSSVIDDFKNMTDDKGNIRQEALSALINALQDEGVL